MKADGRQGGFAVSDGKYDTAQVCMKGHVVTTTSEFSPERMSDFCEKCGEKTMTHCSECGSPIRGYYSSLDLPYVTEYKLPKHCGGCGAPYPWTERMTRTLIGAVEECKEIGPNDLSKLRKSAADIVSNTPKTKQASILMASLLVKMSKNHQDVIKDLLVKFACEAAKDLILG